MNRMDRLFGMLIHLQSKKYVPAEQLGDRFDISVRTVYRDVKALTEAGIPVSHEAGRGYFVVQGFFLSPVAFKTEEANALLIMEKMVQGFADKETSRHYSAAMNKIKAVLRSSEKDKLEKLDQNIGFQTCDQIKLSTSFIPIIQHAISEENQLEINYKNSKEEISERKLEPIGLVFYAFAWHLIGWCHLRADYRDFKLNRIVDLQELDTPFICTSHITISSYMAKLPVKY